MIKVSVTELRNHLPRYLDRVKTGVEVVITHRGNVIAKLVPEADQCGAARQRLEAIRKDSWVGDVISSTGEMWDRAS